MPAQSVDLPKRLPLVIEPQNRDGSVSKDARLVNCYMEQQTVGGETEYWIYKRPGLAVGSQPPAASVSGYGVYNWRGDIYAVFANKLYKNGVAVAGTVDTTGGVYRFSSCLGATPKLQLGNGVKAYNYDDGAGLVLINDVNFPAAFVKGWAYLNATTYVMLATAHIQGSDNNDPVSWDALNDILAQIEPDQGKALAKQLVYVVAFKEWSTEVFYDAGNATGSPLGRVEGAKVNYGCVSADSVQDLDGTLLWIGRSRTAGVQVLVLESLKADVVSTQPIERLLQGADFSSVYSWQVSLDGHRFYVVTLKNENLTLAFDLDQKMWSQWMDINGGYMQIVGSTFDTSGRAILQGESDGRLYYSSADYLDDAGYVFYCDIITPNFDAGVESRGKLMNMMYFVGDKTAGSTLTVRVSDNDYQSWSQGRMVDLSQNVPYLDNCGTFKRRAHWLRHQKPTRMRLKAVELQMDLCTF